MLGGLLSATRRAGTGQSGAALLVVGGGFITQLLATVISIVSARMLGVEGRGQIAFVVALGELMAQLTLGGSLPNALTKMLADKGVTARDGLRHLAGRLVLWSVIAAAVAGAYLFVVEGGPGGSTTLLLSLAAVLMTLQVIASRVLMGSMLGEGTNLLHVAMTGVLPQAATAIVVVAAFVMGVRWTAVQFLAVVLATTIVVLLARVRLLAPPRARDGRDALDAKELWGHARRMHIGSVGPIDGLHIDRALVGTLMSSVLLGLYSAAFALGSLTRIIGRAIAMVVLPQVTRVQGDPVAERRMVRRWLALTAGIVLTIVVPLEIVAGPVIRLTFGEEFVAAETCARWLIAAAGLLDFRRVLIAVLQARDRGGRASLIELALTPVVVGGIVIASVNSSLVGVGVTMFGTAAVACVLHGIAVFRSEARGVDPSPGSGDDEFSTDDHAPDSRRRNQSDEGGLRSSSTGT